MKRGEVIAAPCARGFGLQGARWPVLSVHQGSMLGFQGRHYCSDYLGVVSGDPFTRSHEGMRLGRGKVEQFHASLEQKSRNGDHISGGLGS